VWRERAGGCLGGVGAESWGGNGVRTHNQKIIHPHWTMRQFVVTVRPPTLSTPIPTLPPPNPRSTSRAGARIAQGVSGASFLVEASTVEDVKVAVEMREGVPAAYQVLRCGGVALEAVDGLKSGATIQVGLLLVGGVIEPSLAALARKYNCEKAVCRECYARLPPKAVNCRKKKFVARGARWGARTGGGGEEGREGRVVCVCRCGHSPQVRLKKKLK
jgi:ubiquitin-large subunit ribosomal protein L40e